MKWLMRVVFIIACVFGGNTGRAQVLTVSVTAFSSSSGATVVATAPPGASVTLDQAASIGGFSAWSVVASHNFGTNSTWQFQDSGATSAGQRYYRLRSNALWLGGGQVYSVNIAGFARLNAASGLTLLANPLLATNNTVTGAFRDSENGFSIYRLTATGFEANNYLFGWTTPSMPFAPGEGFFFRNPSGNSKTLAFFGEVPAGNQTIAIPAGHSLLSSKIPQSGLLQNDLGFPVLDFDIVYQWAADSFDVRLYDESFGWDPSQPTLQVGQAFWLLTSVSRNWTRDFSPNLTPLLANPSADLGGGDSSPDLVPAGGPPVQVNFFTYNLNTGFGRVFDSDGTTPAAASYVGQLFAGPVNSAEGNLSAVGSAVAFPSGSAAGYINSGLVPVPGISAGQPIYLQLRVWESARGATYAAAVANGSKNGKSAIFSVTSVAPPSAGPTVPPPSANGFASFSLAGAGDWLAVESFDYPTGAISGRDSGVGFKSAFTGSGSVAPGSLSYTHTNGLAFPATGGRFTTAGSHSGAFRELTTNGQPASALDAAGKFGRDGSIIYVAFLTRIATGDNTGYGGLSLYDGAAERLFFGDPGFAFLRWGYDPQGGTNSVRESSVTATATNRLLVGRIDFASGSETIRLYVDPPLQAEPATASAGPSVVPDFRFTRIRMQSGAQPLGPGGTHSFDEIRLGTTYADVVAPLRLVVGRQPVSTNILEGQSATFRVTAAGLGPLRYQWFRNGTNAVSSGTNASLTLAAATVASAGGYHVAVMNDFGSVSSLVATLTVVANPDRDGDGMPNDWEVLYGLNPDSPFDALSDLDGDGMTNLQEYQTDTSPIDAASNFRIVSVALLGNDSAQVTVATRPGLSYAIQYSDSLEMSLWQPLAQSIASGSSLTFTDWASAASRRFYRAVTDSGSPVYSLNLVGYAKVLAAPGSNYLAAPFFTFPSTVDALIPFPPDGSCVVKAGAQFACFDFGVWEPSGMSLARGEPFEFNNPSGTDFVMAFAGEVAGKPVIVQHPTSTTAQPGENVSLQVASVGAPGWTHQWYFNETDLIEGADGPQLVLVNVQPADAGGYRVVVANGFGAATSLVATVSVQLPPQVKVRVNGALAGTNGVTVTNAAMLTFETTYPGGSIFYTLNGSHPGAGTLYTGPVLVSTLVVVQAIAYNADYTESAESEALTLTVVRSPSITQQPQTQTVLVGQPAVFTAQAVGDAPLAYQWFFNGAALSGATASSFGRDGSLLSHAGSYWVTASNAYGRATSQVAGLTVLLRPSIASQPASTNVNSGQNATFCVSAIGSAPLVFQWRKNGVNIPGATNSCYAIANVQATNAGAYSVVVGNGADAVTSAEAELVLADLPNGPPPEDFFVNRNGLFGNPGALEVNNIGATKELGEPDHAGKPGGASVWYAWAPEESGIATLRTSGSAFDTLLAVYRGSDVSALTPVVANEDGGGFLTSAVSFNATNGVEYQIAVDGFAAAQGSFVLSWSLEVTAQVLPVITSQPQSRTVLAGTDAPFSVSANGSGLTYQWYFNGARINNATTSAFTRTNVQPANVGYYAVAVTNSQSRGLLSEAAILEIGPFPDVRSTDKVEDLLAAPTLPLAGLGVRGSLQPTASGFASVTIGSLGTQVLNTTNSTTSFRETNHCGVIGGSSRWFKLKPAANGLMSIDTFGSTFDTVLAAYTGDPLLGGYPTKLIECNNNAAADARWSRVLYSATNAIEYLIAVDGAGSSAGTVQLNWSLGLPPVIVSNPPPINPLVTEGETLQLTTALTNGLPPPQLQWYRDGEPILDATNATYAVGAAQRLSGGVYTVVAYNSLGSVTGLVANVTVEVPLKLNLQPVVQSGKVHFRVSGVASQTFILQGSTNFVNWQPLYTNQAAGAPVSYDDLTTTNRARRYYRALPWP